LSIDEAVDFLICHILSIIANKETNPPRSSTHEADERIFHAIQEMTINEVTTGMLKINVVNFILMTATPQGRMRLNRLQRSHEQMLISSQQVASSR
jgi:hypothetical protein